MRKNFVFSLLLIALSAFFANGATLHAQALSQDQLEMLHGEWTLEQTLNKEGLELPMPDGPRDRFAFRADYSMTATKKGQSAEAKYKVSLASGELYIGDRVSGRTIKYFIKEVDAKRLVLFFPDEINGSKTLIFSR